jgi:hypothetical protein
MPICPGRSGQHTGSDPRHEFTRQARGEADALGLGLAEDLPEAETCVYNRYITHPNSYSCTGRAVRCTPGEKGAQPRRVSEIHGIDALVDGIAHD